MVVRFIKAVTGNPKADWFPSYEDLHGCGDSPWNGPIYFCAKFTLEIKGAMLIFIITILRI